MIDKATYRNGAFLALGAGAGAGLMYLLDPNRGAYRRAVIREKTLSSVNGVKKGFVHKGQDLANRATGMVAEARGVFVCEDVPDQKLEARVRTELGRLVTKPKTVEVTAHDGVVTLRGWAPAEEMKELLDRVAHVRGVARIESQLAGS